MSAPETPRTHASYPPHWEADVVLSDGGTVHLRPIRPSDGQALLDLHARMSMRTRYLRYFGPYPTMPERDVERFTHVDHHDRVALVAQLGDDIIAVGRYERLEPDGDAAEVAFVAEDAHQGRGLASILLEHLTAAARERGLRRFVAEVLAENATMVRVFRDAGYQIKRAFDSGVLHLEFAIDPTEQSVAVAEGREQAAEARSVHNLLHPRSVAVIGASCDPNKVGSAVLRNLLRGDFAGPVYPVNSEARSVNGVRAYPSVLEIPDEVDLAVVAVPATNVDEVMDQCLAKGVRALVVVTSGFGETGPRGAAAELAMVRQARAHGMRVVGPNALGVANTDPEVRLNATLGPTVPGSGRVGFFAQSGALGIALLATAAERGLGLSTFVSAGNRADVSGNDLLQYWQTDPSTDVVLLYLESFGNPRKFARLARRLAREKPIVAVRSGRHGKALRRKTPESSVPVSEDSVNTLFEQAGVIRVESVGQLFDTALVLAHQPLPAGDRIAVVGNSTALGVLAADTALSQGLSLAGDPVDVGAGASPQEFAAAVAATLARDDIDALVVVYVPPVAVPGTAYARALREAMTAASIPVVSTFLAAEGVPAELAVPGPGGFPGPGSVPSYPSPEQAVLALARVVRYAQWRARPGGRFVRPEHVQGKRALELATSWVRPGFADPAELTGTQAGAARPGRPEGPEGREGAKKPEGPAADGSGDGLVHLSDEQTRELLACYGISVVPTYPVDDVEQAVATAAQLGQPVALKALGTRGWQLSELTGVRLDLQSADAVRAAYEDLAATASHGIVVQRMVAKGRGCVIGVQDDPSFGS
ncbi:MAG TPA: GNAT family N-acetyltransferase, partial [Pseudonocardiaceae bacterium]